ncbi:MAG: TonB-dependent receptor family protein, partial [Candidatus Methylomirabilales bacterium]
DLRLNWYKEQAQTPGGLTAAQFKKDPDQSQRSFDVFESKRISADLNFRRPLLEGWNLNNLIYFNWFERNWFIANAPDPQATSNQQFLREFVVVGIEPRLERGPFVAGFRAHYETQNDVRRRGTSPGAKTGKTDREADLSTTALAGYAKADLLVLPKLTITPGVRFEYFEQERNIGLRGNIGGLSGSKTTNELVGGVGARYELTSTIDLFANYSRGFKPPSFSEAVDPTTGTTNDVDSELSDTYEVGARARFTDWLRVDVTGFWINFKDQIISEAGRLRNAGKTRHQGLETAVYLGPWGGFSANAAATFLDAEFRGGPTSGNDLPMAPEITASWAFRYEQPTKIGKASAQLDGIFVDDQFSDAANTVPESADGKVGELPSYDVWNLRLGLDAIKLPLGSLKLFVGVNNLFDREYRVRRQNFFDGIFPGATRTFYGGFAFKF